jgi:2-polyprenyl-3-methyl-5-hydroxy-6-metoxy-1,4-benzoquinol methylase
LQRIRTPELIDQPDAAPARISESLSDLAWLNRYLGGTATVLHQFDRLLDGGRARTLRILDVGAGGGDILLAVDGWLRRRGGCLDGIALDAGAAAVRHAGDAFTAAGAERRTRVVRGDALALPFGDRSFDVAYSSTFLHHLDVAGAVAVLREMVRVSEVGIVVSDLRRCLSGYLAARALAGTVWRRHVYSRHDGPASMRAAFTTSEAKGLAERAGLRSLIEPQPFFRWALRWRRAR